MLGEGSKVEKALREEGINMTRLYRHKIPYCVIEYSQAVAVLVPMKIYTLWKK